MVYVLTSLGFHVFIDDENVVFQDALNKRGLLVINGEVASFFADIGWAVAGDNCCAGVDIESCYHHPHLYLVDAI